MNTIHYQNKFFKNIKHSYRNQLVIGYKNETIITRKPYIYIKMPKMLILHSIINNEIELTRRRIKKHQKIFLKH